AALPQADHSASSGWDDPHTGHWQANPALNFLIPASVVHMYRCRHAINRNFNRNRLTRRISCPTLTF
ncbi:hypothetical protein AAULR_17394, partial [Lacticaseibacillus rhamnosus MTCC 5462]